MWHPVRQPAGQRDPSVCTNGGPGKPPLLSAPWWSTHQPQSCSLSFLSGPQLYLRLTSRCCCRCTSLISEHFRNQRLKKTGGGEGNTGACFYLCKKPIFHGRLSALVAHASVPGWHHHRFLWIRHLRNGSAWIRPDAAVSGSTGRNNRDS